MASAVYYDPFGQRVAGYRAGMQDEVNLQDQTRRARAADFDFQNFEPIRLAGQQAALADARFNTLGRIADVTGDASGVLTDFRAFQQPNYGITDPAQFAVAARLNQQFAQPGVDFNMDDRNFLLQRTANEFGLPAEALMQDPAFRGSLVAPVGEQGYYIPPGFTNENVDRFRMYDRARQEALDANTLNQQMFARALSEAGLGVDQINAVTQRMFANRSLQGGATAVPGADAASPLSEYGE